MKRVIVGILLVLLVLSISCNGRKRDENDITVLRDSETFLLIPAGTPFKAKATQDGELTEFVKDSNMVVVHPGYLQKLQEEANRNVLRPPDG